VAIGLGATGKPVGIVILVGTVLAILLTIALYGPISMSWPGRRNTCSSRPGRETHLSRDRRAHLRALPVDSRSHHLGPRGRGSHRPCRRRHAIRLVRSDRPGRGNRPLSRRTRVVLVAGERPDQWDTFDCRGAPGRPDPGGVDAHPLRGPRGRGAHRRLRWRSGSGQIGARPRSLPE